MPKGKTGGDLVPVGKIVGAHGIRGGVKLLYYSHLETFPYSYITLQEDGGACRRFKVVSCRPLKGTLALQLEGIHSRTEAQTLTGQLVYCPRGEFPRAATDEFYWIDLIGMTVTEFSRSGEGRVRDLLETGGTDVLEITWEGREYLVPFSYHWIEEISVPDRRLVLKEGTLEFFDVY